MRRREFITLVGGVAAWPLAAGAQQSRSVRNVAVIMGFAESDPVWQSYLATFRQRLDDFGWHEGRNVQFKYWFTGESSERTRAAATEAAAAKPDVILASTNPVISALQQMTQSIPIVFTGSRIRSAAAMSQACPSLAATSPDSTIMNRHSARNGLAS